MPWKITCELILLSPALLFCLLGLIVTCDEALCLARKEQDNG
jgi:hypothetical protein